MKVLMLVCMKCVYVFFLMEKLFLLESFLCNRLYLSLSADIR